MCLEKAQVAEALMLTTNTASLTPDFAKGCSVNKYGVIQELQRYYSTNFLVPRRDAIVIMSCA
jgi:hypothetical protein